MKTLLKMMVFISIFISITSCSNEDTLESMLPTEGSEVHNNTFKFKYQGVEYTAQYELKDSVMVFIDSTINDMLTELNQNPNTSTLIYPNGTVEYFDSSQDLEDFLKKENTITRGFLYHKITSLTLKVYEHANFGGKVLTYNGYTEVINMKNAAYIYANTINFNDIISSFQLTVKRDPSVNGYNRYPSAILIFYRHAEFKGSSRAFILDVDHLQVALANFKSIDFNDEISSFKLWGASSLYPPVPN